MCAHLTAARCSFLVWLGTQDGAVANERDICRYVRDTDLSARVFTLGIGTLCNTYFLKMLAQIGAGYSASALRFRTLRDDILGLMSKMDVR